MKKSILLFLLIFTSIIYGQTGSKVSGTVVDGKGLTIPGVTVTSDVNSVSTDIDGKYTIAIKNSKTVLKFTFVGFEPQIVVVGKERTIDITLKESVSTLDEVVVIGYGTQKRSSVTGSVSKYQNEKLNELAVSRVDQALQGKIAGVVIQNTSSEAGANPKISIRGISSITAGADPLVVVDGQINQDGLGSLNMADIQSVEVLKDAASAAIYGSRGGAGVILVTTKSGKTDKVRFKLNYQTGFKNPYEIYPMLTSSDYVRKLYSERDLKKLDPTVNQALNVVSANNNAMWLIEQELLGGKGTDYQDEALRTGVFKTIGLSASGGTDKSKYYISFGYNGDEGMMIHSDFQKYNLLAKLNFKLSDKVKLDVNMNPGYSTREQPSENFTDFVRYPSFLTAVHTDLTEKFVGQNSQWTYLQAGDYANPRHFNNLTYPSMGMVGLLPDGTIMATRTNVSPFSSAQNNPLGEVERQFDNTEEYRFQGSAALTFKLATGLDFKTSGSGYYKSSDRLQWANREATGDGVLNGGTYTKRTFYHLISDNIFSYKKSFGKHALDAIAGFTAEKTNQTDQTVIGTNYPSDNIRTLNNATTVTIPVGTPSAIYGVIVPNTDVSTGLLSYLARVNYAFDDKYLLSMSIRADGSSYFGAGNKWGTFPAASLGWKVNKENFMSEVDWMDKLMLRASFGTSGNNRIGDFLFIDTLVNANYISGSGSGTAASGLAPNAVIQSNQDITWESTYQTNIGIDLSLFKSKLNLTVEAYQSTTDKLLLNSATQYFTGVPQFIDNIGSLTNKGIEVELQTTNIKTKSFKWTTAANFSHTENRINDLSGEPLLRAFGERSEVYQAKVGDPLTQFYGYKTDGVWLSQADIDAARAAGLTSNLGGYFTPGGLKLKDIDGNNVIDDKDRTVVGNPYPNFTWGMTNNFTYKAFDLNFSLQGSQGGELINGDANYNETKRFNKNYTENRWISAAYPGDGQTPYELNGFNWMLTDYVVEDASYVALRDITIGYTMPEEFAKKCLVNGMRLYFSGQNMYFYSASGYRGINTEARSTTNQYANPIISGYQRGGFPIAKTVVFGIDINF